MTFRIDLKPVERVVFHSDVVAMGTFRCGSAEPLYRDSGPCTHHTFVFPRTSTAIRHDGGASFVGSPLSVSLYNQHQRYSRGAIDPIDASDWFVLSDQVLVSAIAEFDPAVEERRDRPFRVPVTAIDGETYMQQRRLFEAVAADDIDPLLVEERALQIFGRVLASVYGPSAEPLEPDDVVEHAKEIIVRRCTSNVPLRELAALVGVSPFHLCRSFRASTGRTITTFRHELRLRIALERLSERTLDLTDLALDLGYSSHSHFTAAFRRRFGTTPALYRNGGRASRPQLPGVPPGDDELARI